MSFSRDYVFNHPQMLQTNLFGTSPDNSDHGSGSLLVSRQPGLQYYKLLTVKGTISGLWSTIWTIAKIPNLNTLANTTRCFHVITKCMSHSI